MSQRTHEVDTQGPWIAAALFCDAIIEDESTGSRSLLRLHQGGEFFDDLRSSAYGEPVLFLSFIGGGRVGTFTFEIIGHLPGKPPMRVAIQEFRLDGPGSGHDAFAPIRIDADVEGIAWFDVVIEGSVVTRMAYRILHVVRRGTAEHAAG
jgi:hypothetical protein